uniref:RALY heteroous nuclear ribonucleoprotein n=1 Tax=Bos mutus grunniens TaxID=30521 RepID=A0A8B9WTS5_BOSMU
PQIHQLSGFHWKPQHSCGEEVRRGDHLLQVWPCGRLFCAQGLCLCPICQRAPCPGSCSGREWASAGRPDPGHQHGWRTEAQQTQGAKESSICHIQDLTGSRQRLFDYRGRLSPVPVPRAVPVKRPRVTVPLVRRVKTTIPVKLFARSTAITTGTAKIKLKSSELQTIKTELTQIKSNIDALLGRLEQIAEEQKANPDGKKKGESSSGSGSGGGSGSSGTGGSSRPPAPPEDTASEAGTPQGEAQARDDGDEEGLLTHSEEELVRACLGGRLGLVCVPLVAGGLQGVGGHLLTAWLPCELPPSLPGVLIL